MHRRAATRSVSPLRVLVVLLALVVIAVIVVGVGLATEGPPEIQLTRVVSTELTVPGPAPVIAWPAHGGAAVTVDGVGPIGTSGPGTPVAIASVAKVMTAYVVLQDAPLTANGNGYSYTVTAADAADEATRAAQGQSVLSVAAGEVLTERQLLEGLLLPSGNNVAAILASKDAGAIPAFVTKMQAAAQKLGMTHTTYTDPSGFTTTTVSTAADQTLLAAAAMAEPGFAQIVALPSATLPVVGTITNFNSLLGQDGFVGIKTGSESDAGGCLVFEDDRMVAGRKVRIYGAVLSQDVGTLSTSTIVAAALNASRTLADSVTAGLGIHTVLPAGTTVARATNADGRQVPVITRQSVPLLGYAGLRIPVQVHLVPPGSKLHEGDRAATVTLAGATPVTVPATATATMPGPSLSYQLGHMF